MKTLIAIDIGLEFGWKLFRWIPNVRHLSKEYDTTFVVTTLDTFTLYRDFAMHIDTIDTIDATKNMWRYDGVKIDYLYPTKSFCCDINMPQKFHRYENHNCSSYPGSDTIIIHARNRDVGKNRNWSKDKWDDLVTILRKKGYIVASIGTDVLDIDVDVDCRNVGLGQLCKVIAAAKMVVGPSSGVMHLASLCNCPHIIWTDNKKWNLGSVKGTNRERYESVWNPFRTKVAVIDEYGWQPSVSVVIDEIYKT